MITKLFFVFIGGGFGSIIRFLVGISIQKTSTHLPLATLISNVLACFLFGLSLYLMQFKWINEHTGRALLLTGLCGGLSTFSTFGYETWLLLSRQDYTIAIANILLSLVLCLLMFYVFKIPAHH